MLGVITPSIVATIINITATAVITHVTNVKNINRLELFNLVLFKDGLNTILTSFKDDSK